MLPTGHGKDLLLVQCTCMRHNVKDTLCLDQVVVQVGGTEGEGGLEAASCRRTGSAVCTTSFCTSFQRSANDLLTLRVFIKGSQYLLL